MLCRPVTSYRATLRGACCIYRDTRPRAFEINKGQGAAGRGRAKAKAKVLALCPGAPRSTAFHGLRCCGEAEAWGGCIIDASATHVPRRAGPALEEVGAAESARRANFWAPPPGIPVVMARVGSAHKRVESQMTRREQERKERDGKKGANLHRTKQFLSFIKLGVLFSHCWFESDSPVRAVLSSSLKISMLRVHFRVTLWTDSVQSVWTILLLWRNLRILVLYASLCLNDAIILRYSAATLLAKITSDFPLTKALSSPNTALSWNFLLKHLLPRTTPLHSMT